jgi:hypothetical protein
MAVAMIVNVVLLKPRVVAMLRPSCRAVTMSAED